MTRAPDPLAASAPPVPPEPLWSVRAPAPPRVADALSRALGVPPWLAALLWQRGYASEDPEATLRPALARPPLPGLRQAAERLSRALDEGERILLHGDYDADGITGTALLTLGLRRLGGHVETHLPNRLIDGYGLRAERVDAHAARCDLLITIDCGIANVDEVRRLREADVDVIVTDHHLPGEALPDALVVHPSLADEAHPGGAEPTGAGVAFFLLWEVHHVRGLPDPLEFADLATLGTIADVAPLLGVNRAIVDAGLSRLQDSAWPGLRAMLAQSHLRNEPSARDVAFVLAPRLNAAGRLADAEAGLELLTTASERRARTLAVYLDGLNEERKRLQEEMFAQAEARVDPAAPAIVVADDAWHPGVMGIVASKLLERHYKPVFIVAKGQGSVRSAPELPAIEGLRAARAHLQRFGGHRVAAGFALDPEALPAFRDAIHAWAGARPAPRPRVLLDALLPPRRVDGDLWRALQALEPYGEGHPPPRFGLCERLDAARSVGREQRHLQLRVGGLKGVSWGRGELATRLPVGAAVNAAVVVRENEWQGRRRLEFEAEAVRRAAPLALDGGADTLVSQGLAPIRRGAVAGRDGAPASGRLLREVPLDADPMRAHRPLAALLREGRPLIFALSQEALVSAAHAADLYPSADDVRRAYVALRRGHPLRDEGTRAELLLRILRELDLLDARGLPRAGVKRAPYESATLRAGLLQRYRLDGLTSAYRDLDDAGFEAAVHVLFGPDGDVGAAGRVRE